MYIGMALASIIKEMLMITFSLWCPGLLTNSVRRYAHKVPLFKKWVNYKSRKGLNWK